MRRREWINDSLAVGLEIEMGYKLRTAITRNQHHAKYKYKRQLYCMIGGKAF
jgi:hypothetical protein